MRHCPNCGEWVDEDENVCANCGVDPDAVWTPPLEGRVEVLKGRAGSAIEFWAGFVPSCGTGLVIWFIAAFTTFGYAYEDGSVHYGLKYNAICYGAAVLVQTLWYLLARPSHPHSARGVGASVFVTLTCFLGALTVCR